MIGWIPTEERLPDVKCDRFGNMVSNLVLVQDKDEWITMAYLKPGRPPVFERMEENGPIYFGSVDDVVAWMPLPKPYKPKKNERE